MGAKTKIQWAHHTFNPWRGCSKVHTGCSHCYAEVNYSVKMHGIKWGTAAQGGTRMVLSEAGWREPLTWNRQAEQAGERRRVFCASLADVFDDFDGPIINHHGKPLYRDGVAESWADFIPSVPHSFATIDDLRRRLFALIDRTPWLDWLLVTKRPENVRRMWPGVDVQSQQQADDRNERGELFRRNCWLLTSVSDQQTADKMIPELLKCRDLVPVLGVSAEPLLGELRLRPDLGLGWQCERCGGTGHQEAGHWDGKSYAAPAGVCDLCGGAGRTGHWLKWVIVGGESDQTGKPARPCDVRHVRSIVQQCRAEDVPVFVKQLGSNTGKSIAGAGVRKELGTDWLPYRFDDPKGGDPDEWPEDLWVRGFPVV